MREQKGVRGRVFYERYAALGGDPTYIRGQLYLSRRLPGYLALPPNCRAKGIADTDDEDPDGERVPTPVIEEEEEGSKEVPHAGGGGENAPEVGATTTAATASVEVEGAARVGSSSVAAPPTMMGRGRGRGTTGMSTPRAPMMPPVSELPDLNSPTIRRMIESL